ncbi:hypothetical protein FRC01_006317 [Tulasnella sp. 417]|nr:hypothetical protein FRC01_006317 [Tulasnella sp. 417]
MITAKRPTVTTLAVIKLVQLVTQAQLGEVPSGHGLPIRCMGSTTPNEADFQGGNSGNINLHFEDNTADPSATVKKIMAVKKQLWEGSPETSVDIILVPIGGTGSGKGLTLMTLALPMPFFKSTMAQQLGLSMS